MAKSIEVPFRGLLKVLPNNVKAKDERRLNYFLHVLHRILDLENNSYKNAFIREFLIWLYLIYMGFSHEKSSHKSLINTYVQN